jgi:hypothetical protein
VNACYWATDLEKNIPKEANMDNVGSYNPTMFGFGEYLKNKNQKITNKSFKLKKILF